MYRFSTADVATVTGDNPTLTNALDDVRVVPNPYYAYSQYETSKLDNRVKITGLPEVCTVRIYNLAGTLVRTFDKADPLTYLEWDLKNDRNVPIAGGVHIVHVDAPGVGEKIVKWFAVMRPVDLENFLIMQRILLHPRPAPGGRHCGPGPSRQPRPLRFCRCAGQLLILPWALSSGVAGANTALVTGIEASFSNVAGLAFVNRTELAVCNQQYLVGTDIQLNSAGFVQAVGGGHIGVSVTSMTFGDIEITTEDLPEGGIGAYRPTFSNIGISYAKAFSNSIYGGLTVRMISESISNVRAQRRRLRRRHPLPRRRRRPPEVRHRPPQRRCPCATAVTASP